LQLTSNLTKCAEIIGHFKRMYRKQPWRTE
jgi:hypothetical protein